MDENIIEKWRIIDKWWTDRPVEREYKVLSDKTTLVRERINEDEWSDWTEVKID